MSSIFKIKDLELFGEKSPVGKVEDDYERIVSRLKREVDSVINTCEDNGSFGDINYFIDKLESFFSDSNLDTYLAEGQVAKDVIEDMTRQLIACHKLLKGLTSGAKDLITEDDIHNVIDGIEEQILPDNANDLESVLRGKGWGKIHIEFAENICGVSFKNKRMHLESLNSFHCGIVMCDASGRVVIREGSLRIYSGKATILMRPVAVRKTSATPGVVTRFEDGDSGKVVFFHPSDLVSYFKDINNPTEGEILMYEMATGDRYDIPGWKTLFNLNG